jgi:hypothetical protein
MAQIGDQCVHAASQWRPGNLAGDFGDIRLDMADREHPAAFARQTKHHRAPEPAQPAGHNCIALFHHPSPFEILGFDFPQ